MPWPATALLTGWRAFGFSLSNQGSQFYMCLWCRSTVSHMLVFVGFFSSLLSACVILISESHSAALFSLLHCRDLIGVLADRAEHGSGQGRPHDPAEKFLMTVSVMPHRRKYKRRGFYMELSWKAQLGSDID